MHFFERKYSITCVDAEISPISTPVIYIHSLAPSSERKDEYPFDLFDSVEHLKTIVKKGWVTLVVPSSIQCFEPCLDLSNYSKAFSISLEYGWGVLKHTHTPFVSKPPLTSEIVHVI